MLKPILNRNEADIYDCLSRDESFVMSDLENLGPWHKYGGSIHQELQRISSLSISEHEQVLSSKRPQQLTNRRTFVQQESKSQENLLSKSKEQSNSSKDIKNRTQVFKQKVQNKKEISQKKAQTLLYSNSMHHNPSGSEKQNVGFFVKCYPERGLLKSSVQNFQTSKDYFEKIALKMMYGINRKQEETDNSKCLNSSKKSIMNQTANGRRNYFLKKELKFNESINSLLQPQKSRIPFHKIINKKTLVSFASQHQQEYQQMKRMVSS